MGRRENVVFEPRFAENRLERLTELATDLVRLKVDVIAAAGTRNRRRWTRALGPRETEHVQVIHPRSLKTRGLLDHDRAMGIRRPRGDFRRLRPTVPPRH
jgi:hypothetical protein